MYTRKLFLRTACHSCITVQRSLLSSSNIRICLFNLTPVTSVNVTWMSELEKHPSSVVFSLKHVCWSTRLISDCADSSFARYKQTRTDFGLLGITEQTTRLSETREVSTVIILCAIFKFVGFLFMGVFAWMCIQRLRGRWEWNGREKKQKWDL